MLRIGADFTIITSIPVTGMSPGGRMEAELNELMVQISAMGPVANIHTVDTHLVTPWHPWLPPMARLDTYAKSHKYKCGPSENRALDGVVWAISEYQLHGCWLWVPHRVCALNM